MIPRTLIVAGLFSVAHFILFLAVAFVCLMFGSYHLDNPSTETPLLLAAGTILVDILGFPGFYIWEQFQLGSRLPVVFQYLTIAANSLLWGCAFACVFARKKI